MTIKLLDFYNLMDQDDIILSYKGDVSSDLVSSVLQIIESKMDKLEEPSKIRKKVYNVLVETLQNLYHHIAENPGLSGKEEVSSVIFLKSSFLKDFSSIAFTLEDAIILKLVK